MLYRRKTKPWKANCLCQDGKLILSLYCYVIVLDKKILRFILKFAYPNASAVQSVKSERYNQERAAYTVVLVTSNSCVMPSFSCVGTSKGKGIVIL